MKHNKTDKLVKQYRANAAKMNEYIKLYETAKKVGIPENDPDMTQLVCMMMKLTEETRNIIKLIVQEAESKNPFPEFPEFPNIDKK